MDLEDKQGHIHDLMKSAQALLDDLSSAESCENETDFKVNVEDAIDQAKDVLRVLNALLRGKEPE